MNSVIQLYTPISSVPSNFSWDSGSFTPSNQLTLTTDGQGNKLYIGYAPLVNVSILTSLVSSSPDIAQYLRIVDFGDYYNFATNSFSFSGTKTAILNHTYIMPGAYQIQVYSADYRTSDFYTENIIETSNSSLSWSNIPGVVSEEGILLHNASAFLDTDTSTFLISVVEIPPIAYLYSESDSKTQVELVFPFQATLTPKYTQAGSFPIDYIAWNLGDGTPTFFKRRWDNGSTTIEYQGRVYNFKYNNSLPNDPNDPRNYDLTYTYNSDGVNDTFYPSITAYACSTSTSSVGSTIVGPLLGETYNSNNFENKIELIQNEFNKNGSAILTQFGTNIGLWTTT